MPHATFGVHFGQLKTAAATLRYIAWGALLAVTHRQHVHARPRWHRSNQFPRFVSSPGCAPCRRIAPACTRPTAPASAVASPAPYRASPPQWRAWRRSRLWVHASTVVVQGHFIIASDSQLPASPPQWPAWRRSCPCVNEKHIVAFECNTLRKRVSRPRWAGGFCPYSSLNIDRAVCPQATTCDSSDRATAQQ